MRKFLKNKKLIVVISIIVVSLTYYFIRKNIDNYNSKDTMDIVSTIDYTDEDDNAVQTETKENEEANFEETEDKMYIYVTGEVNNPGVVSIDKGGRIIDAINAAGGETESANLNKINLAYILEDGIKVNIPSDDDLEENSNFKYIINSSGEGNENIEEDVNEEKEEKTSKYNSKVNINTATQTELETLPGIGPSLALKIIKYRQENGKFSNIEEIKEVKGIGDSKYEEIKEFIIN